MIPNSSTSLGSTTPITNTQILRIYSKEYKLATLNDVHQYLKLNKASDLIIYLISNPLTPTHTLPSVLQVNNISQLARQANKLLKDSSYEVICLPMSGYFNSHEWLVAKKV